MAHRLMAYRVRSCLAISLFLILCFAGFGSESSRAQEQAGAVTPAEGPGRGDTTTLADCRELIALIQQQKSLITREAGQLKREIAALRDDLSQPGIKEIFAGIGYIFGFAGIGLYVHSRKTKRK